MKTWRRLLLFSVLLTALLMVALLLGHLALDVRGRGSLKVAGSHLEDLSQHALKHSGDRPSVCESGTVGNAAALYREVLDPLRLSVNNQDSVETINVFFEGESVETVDLERDLAANEAILQTLRKAVRSSRCDWDLTVAIRRTCGLGGATIARVGFDYEPWTFGLYYLAPRLAAAGELARRRGDPVEAIGLLVESMGVCLDMTRGTDSFNARTIPIRLERLCELLMLYSRDLKSEDPEWSRAEEALARLHHGSEAFLKAWKLDLLLPMYGEVYLPTYPRMVLLDRDESQFSSGSAVLKHLVVTLDSPHASAAKLYLLYEDLWRAMDQIPMTYDPACLGKVEEAVREVRAKNVFHRDGVDSVKDAVVAAFRLEAALRMTRVAWRLARHRSRTGAWPESLESIAVPAGWEDPFTGKQFSYIREKRPLLSTDGRLSDRTHLPYQPLKWSLPE